jgi:NAD(P)-dependent dehydrogenase (short-subunit alcohol dehydrogenase family)
MNKIAVVTGGAGGIGQAIAERFAKDKQTVVLLDMNEGAGTEIIAAFRKRGIEQSFLRADLTREAEVQAIFDKIKADHGRIDVLVNVAGGSMHRHLLQQFPLAHWQAIIDANLTSTFLCCRAVVGMMKNQKTGAIINISSDIAFSGDAGRSAYAAAKAGAKRIPLGHAGDPEDVAEAAAYLSSAGAKHVTGQTIHVNGGRIMT